MGSEEEVCKYAWDTVSTTLRGFSISEMWVGTGADVRADSGTRR
jgi:hypothetical protein